MAEEKRRTWVRFRHRVATGALRALLGPVIRWRYGADIEGADLFRHGPQLILYNHQTPCDQFFLALSFHRPLYYLATEDIFS